MSGKENGEESSSLLACVPVWLDPHPAAAASFCGIPGEPVIATPEHGEYMNGPISSPCHHKQEGLLLSPRCTFMHMSLAKGLSRPRPNKSSDKFPYVPISKHLTDSVHLLSLAENAGRQWDAVPQQRQTEGNRRAENIGLAAVWRMPGRGDTEQGWQASR